MDIIWHVLKIIAVLAACVILRAGVHAYHNAMAFRAGVNLRRIRDELVVYANGHHGHYPDHLTDLLFQNTQLMPEQFVVPWGTATPITRLDREELIKGNHCSYGYLGAGLTSAEVGPENILAYEADGESPIGGIYCLYGDGHGSNLPTRDAIKSIIDSVEYRDRLVATRPSTAP